MKDYQVTEAEMKKWLEEFNEREAVRGEKVDAKKEQELLAEIN